MTILGIETSCDETAAAIIEGRNNSIALQSHVVASSLALHATTGGVIPENAAREQLKYILPVIQEALIKAFPSETKDPFDSLQKVDAFAVTYGPGLIGSLLVGIETIKTLGFVLHKPIIPVNHMVGHIYANWIEKKDTDITFPAIVLVISGGHTDLLLMKNHGDFTLLGGTRDDAAGEAFDKIGRLLGLDYPAGPIIEQEAKKGDPKRFRFPRPLIGSNDYDFSFSGLKAAALREVQQLKRENDLSPQLIADLARATQDAISDVLIKKTIRAVEQYGVSSLLLSGGVAANHTLATAFQQKLNEQQIPVTLFVPSREFCTDNAAMIATAAFYNNHPASWSEITANPELYF